MGRPNTIDDFWANVEKTDTCWLWTMGVGSHGYGQFSYQGKQHLAHRFSWFLATGEYPPSGHELEIDHTCRVRRCVNPAHLELVTHAVNIQRTKPYWVYASRKTCKNGHPITEENTKVRIQQGYEVFRCRICDNEKTARYLARKRSG